MKKISSLFAFMLLLFPFWAKAQDDSKIRVGIRISPIISMARITDANKTVPDDIDVSGRMGLSTLVNVKYHFTEKIGLYTGANLVLKGYKYNFSSNSADAEVRSSLTTIEVPIALHMRTNEITDGIRIRGFFGISNNFLVGAKTVTEASGVKTTVKGTKGYSIYVPDFIAGIGTEWDLGNVGMIDAGISYHHALSRTSKNIGDNANSYRVKINYIALDLGYFF